MKTKLIFPLIFVGFGVVACGGDGARRGDQKAFETVQEGSAAGVTSTLQGPGETLPPITGTNADTTTAFTIDPNAVAATPGMAPAPMPGSGTLAGTLPSQPAYPGTPPAAMTPSAPQQRPAPATPQRTSPAARPQPAESQPVDEQPTDPATTTAQQQPPVTNEAPPQQQPQPKPPAEQQPPAGEEEEEAPPPPTNTDTRGH